MEGKLLDDYKALLTKKKEADNKLTSTQAILTSKEQEYEKLVKKVFEKYGVTTLEELKAMKVSKEQEISTALDAIKKECPELMEAR